MNPAPRILVIEDDQQLAASLTQGLREAGFAVEQAGTAAAAREALDRTPPDLMILDLGLPDEDGLALLQELRARQDPVPIIITTARGTLDQRLAGLDAGADDYLVKPYAFAELVARIQVQLRRAPSPATALSRLADLELDRRTRTAQRAGGRIELTPREFDLLAYLFDARGQVVSREMLARAVWQVRGRTLSMDNVIDVHLSRLREKIDRTHAVKLLHTVRGVGFALKEDR